MTDIGKVKQRTKDNLSRIRKIPFPILEKGYGMSNVSPTTRDFMLIKQMDLPAETESYPGKNSGKLIHINH